MKLLLPFTIFSCVSFITISQSQHNFEFYNNGSVVTVEAGAELHVWGDFYTQGGAATLENNGLIKVQGHSYSDNIFQQRGTGTFRIQNSDINIGETQLISGSYAVRGGQAQIGFNDGSFYNLELANDQGIVYLVGTGSVADVRSSVNFFYGSVQNRIITHDITLGIPANGNAYSAVFGMMNPTAGNVNFLNNTITLNGNMSGLDAGYVQGKLRRAINPAGGVYGFPLGLEPAGAGAQRGVQYSQMNFGGNDYDVISGYFQSGLDNTFASSIECSGFLMNYFGGVDHGQWVFDDEWGFGSGTYEMRVWPQDDNFPAQSVWLISKDNSIQGTVDDCGPSPVGLDRAGFNGFSQFGVVASTDFFLPIELININANGIEDHIAVSWNVASETNLSHYELERSEDGVNFHYMTSKNAVGNTTSAQSYSYDDFDVRYFTQYYYRVKSVDVDGDIEITPVVSASIQNSSSEFDENAVAVFPNPTTDHFAISIQSSIQRTIQVQLYNALGQLIEAQEMNLQEGNTLLKCSLEDRAYGMYMLEIRDTQSNQLITKRIVKQ